MKKIIGVLVIAGVLCGISYALWMFYMPHQNVEKAKPQVVSSTTDLLKIFDEDHTKANSDLVDNIVEFSGIITEIQSIDEYSLISFDEKGDFVIQAYLDKNIDVKLLIKNQKITLKGKYAGLIINDDDFMIPADIKFEQCFIVD